MHLDRIICTRKTFLFCQFVLVKYHQNFFKINHNFGIWFWHNFIWAKFLGLGNPRDNRLVSKEGGLEQLTLTKYLV